jgi:hypothetical protein
MSHENAIVNVETESPSIVRDLPLHMGLRNDQCHNQHSCDLTSP